MIKMRYIKMSIEMIIYKKNLVSIKELLERFQCRWKFWVDTQHKAGHTAQELLPTAYVNALLPSGSHIFLSKSWCTDYKHHVQSLKTVIHVTSPVKHFLSSPKSNELFSASRSLLNTFIIAFIKLHYNYLLM